MKRRDFFGYSMIVLADPALGQDASPQPPPSGGRPDFDRIAPPGPARGRLHPADPHIGWWTSRGPGPGPITVRRELLE